MAGKPGTVTIATNMAGRGTDIMLGGNAEFLAKQEMRKNGYEEEVIGLAVGSSISVSDEVLAARGVYKELFAKYRELIKPDYEKVCAAGGLFIIGTERHESRRIDNQLKGRAGRQGDPGESRFFISMQDDLMRLFSGDKMLNMVQRMGIPEEEPIDHPMLSNSIETAQKRRESDNFQRRRNVLNYDDVMNQQRNLIYKERRNVLDGAVISDKVQKMIEESIDNAIGQYLAGDPAEWDLEGLRKHFFGIIFKENDLKYTDEELENLTIDDIRELMISRADHEYNFRLETLGEERFREIERVILLRSVDLKWMDHLDAMDDLRGSVGLNAYAHRNPLTEYRIEGADMFDAMVAQIREDTVRMVLSFRTSETIKREAVSKITGTSSAGDDTSMKKKPLASVKGEGVKAPVQKVGANDPCPCGSGKKYKKCCGLGSSEK